MGREPTRVVIHGDCLPTRQEQRLKNIERWREKVTFLTIFFKKDRRLNYFFKDAFIEPSQLRDRLPDIFILNSVFSTT